MTLKECFLLVVLWPYFHSKFRFEITFTDFDKEREDPYVLVGNHASLHDALYTLINLKKKYPYPVMNTFVITNSFMEAVLTKLVHTVHKRKGQSDFSVIKGMLSVFRRDKRGILLYPEGNSSFFGKESDYPFSTVKFLKKVQLDIVMCKINGAYLAAPRWGIPARRGYIELHFYTLIKGAELEKMSLEEIDQKLRSAMAFNDYDWNREKRVRYDNRHRAEGLQSYIYVCPQCNNHKCLYTEGDSVYCTHCGKIASFNEYGFIEGLPFDNLVEWDRYQKQYLSRIAKEKLTTCGQLYEVNVTTFRRKRHGRVDIELDKGILQMDGRKQSLSFNVSEIEGLVLTKKRDLSFDYQGKTYYVPFHDPMLFFDVINYLKGGN